MKKKILKLTTIILMFITTQIPNMVFNSYFQYSTEPLPTIYNSQYILISITWIIFFYYIVRQLQHLFDEKP